MSTIERSIVDRIRRRLVQPPELLQVLVGPRQVGKTTAARQIGESWDGPVHYAAADVPAPPGPEWVETQWHLARGQIEERPGLLILDEVQKVDRWSEVVKALWDEDRARGVPLCVLLLGSSALLLARGTTESLAGRFFLHRMTHWTFPEFRRLCGSGLARWIYFGGFPGAAALMEEEDDWRSYVTDSLVETVLARDVLALHTVGKPALLRNLFFLAARLPARVISYTKMLGQLTDAGNTTTLSRYLRLLETAFLASGLERFSAGKARSRGSTPKLVLWNNAFVNALSVGSFEATREDPARWGWLVENAVGAHLLNHLAGTTAEVTYWRHRNDEVDFVVERPDGVWAIEVKSGRPARPAGITAFRRAYPRARAFVVGSGGMPLDEFFSTDPAELLT